MRGGLLLVLVMVSSAGAQSLGPGMSGYVPTQNYRQSQPLSPYLNLLRGGDPSINYFYGVRPANALSSLNTPQLPPQYGPRQTFFPVLDTLAEVEPGQPTTGLPPTGHPYGFNNPLGYYGSPTSQWRGTQPAATLGGPRGSRFGTR